MEGEAQRRRQVNRAPRACTALAGLAPAEAVLVALSLLAVCMLLLDPLVMVALQHLEDGPRQFFRSFTDIAKSRWPLMLGGCVLLVLYLLGPQATSRKAEAARRHAAHMAWFMVAAVALTGVAVNLTKNVIGRARPKFFEELGSVSFHPFSFDYDFASFPSGHATSIFCLAAVAAIFWPRARVYIFLLAAWIAATRFLIGSHYLSDTIAGALFGMTGAYMLRDRLANRRILFRRTVSGGLVLRGRLTLEWAQKRLKSAILVRQD